MRSSLAPTVWIDWLQRCASSARSASARGVYSSRRRVSALGKVNPPEHVRTAVIATKEDRMSAFHPLRTLEGAESAEAWPEGWGCEVPPGSILVGAGKCEHSSLAPHRPGDLHSNRQAFRGKPAWDGNGGDPERTHGLRSIADARGERQVRGIPWTDVRELLGWGAIGCDDQIDFLECRLNRAPELVELVARRGIFGGRDCLPDLQSVPEQGPVQFWNSFEIGPMVGIGFRPLQNGEHVRVDVAKADVTNLRRNGGYVPQGFVNRRRDFGLQLIKEGPSNDPNAQAVHGARDLASVIGYRVVPARSIKSVVTCHGLQQDGGIRR